MNTIILFITIISKLFFLGPNQNGFAFLLEKIDNQAIIYVNSQPVYDSKTVEGNPELELEINLDAYLTDQKDTVKITLLNGGSSFVQKSSDKHWEVRYEFFQGYKTIDYRWESGDDGQTGVVFEETYLID
ncbi:MAG: hypothetical protein JXQ90_21505 [Cyclobacteriaceae bacterium]